MKRFLSTTAVLLALTATTAYADSHSAKDDADHTMQHQSNAADTDAMNTEMDADTDATAAAEVEGEMENEQSDEIADTDATENDDMTTTAETENLDAAETQEAELTRPTMQLEGYLDAEAADLQQLTSDDVEGSYVYGMNDETVGEIDTLLMDADGQVTDAVINVGGFLGLGEKPVKVAFDRIQVLKGEEGEDYRFYIESSEEKLEAMPEYKED